MNAVVACAAKWRCLLYAGCLLHAPSFLHSPPLPAVSLPPPSPSPAHRHSSEGGKEWGGIASRYGLVQLRADLAHPLPRALSRLFALSRPPPSQATDVFGKHARARKEKRSRLVGLSATRTASPPLVLLPVCVSGLYGCKLSACVSVSACGPGDHRCVRNTPPPHFSLSPLPPPVHASRSEESPWLSHYNEKRVQSTNDACADKVREMKSRCRLKQHSPAALRALQQRRWQLCSSGRV